ncbi:MAG: hypothetical protein R3279_03760 [Putridiphycobacter sp.]|nr:hypothetical protein [Putridiphycobacter sp.]
MKQRFHFSKAERVGIAVLGLIIVSLLVFLNIPRHNFVEDIFLEDSSKVAWVDSKDKIIDSLSIPKG